MRKRLLSILLACAMILTLVPMTASAADVIDYITVIKLTEPAVGEKPDKTAMTTYRDNSRGENPRLKISNITWEGKLDQNGCFTYNQSYTVKITVDIKSGYDVKFGNTLKKYAGKETDNVRINNDASKLVSCSDSRAVISYTWGPASGGASSGSSPSGNAVNVGWISVVNLTEPVVGVAPDLSANTTTVSGKGSVVNTKVKEIEWTGMFDDRDVFLPGEPYTVEITVVLKDGVEGSFNLNELKRGTNNEHATINGDPATVTRASKDEIVLSYTWAPSDSGTSSGSSSESTKSNPFKVSVVTITGLDEPVVGEKPDLSAKAVSRSTGSTSGIHTKVESVTWTGMFDDRDVFLPGEPYTVDIEVVMKDGENAIFSGLKKGQTSTNTLINGDHATVTSVSEDRLVISYTWGPSEEEPETKPATPAKPSTPSVPAPAKPALPATGTAYTSTQAVNIDGNSVVLQAYALKDANGNLTNYVKLRDIAYALNGTAAQFAVGWDGNVNILTKQKYTPTGSEMKTPYSGNRPYYLPTAVTNIDGRAADLTAIVLQDNAGGGYTYYQLRDLGRTLGFNVGWTLEKGIFIETNKPYGN